MECEDSKKDPGEISDSEEDAEVRVEPKKKKKRKHKHHKHKKDKTADKESSGKWVIGLFFYNLIDAQGWGADGFVIISL